MRQSLLIAILIGLLWAPAETLAQENQLSQTSYQGSIHAQGLFSLFGLIKVHGTLSFSDSLLFWSAKGSLDSIPYQWRLIDDHLMFTGRAVIENDETVSWRGFYNGRQLEDVHATWTRTEGDSFMIYFYLKPW